MQQLTVEAISIVIPDVNQPSQSNALVRKIDEKVIESVIRPRFLKKIDRFSQIGLIVFEHLKSVMKDEDPNKIGLFIGNDLGGWEYVQSQLEDLFRTNNVQAINPYVATAWFPAAAQGEISITHNIRGYSKSLSGGLLSSALAIEHAAQRLFDGTIDLAFAGGIEAPAAPITIDALKSEQRITPDFPASEGGCLLALRRFTGAPGPRVSLSKPSRHPDLALDDIKSLWCHSKKVDIYLPKISINDKDRSQIIDELRRIIIFQLGEAACFKKNDVDLSDFGSVTFALNLASTITHFKQKTILGVPSLVFGTDFNGLFLAAIITE